MKTYSHGKQSISPKNIRLLSKQRYFEEFMGAYGAQDRSVHVVHEDPSTEATQNLPKERMFRKKSIDAKTVEGHL
jgi:hypothetical protein